MNKFVAGLALSILTLNAYAFDERDASKLVRNYSEIIACQLDGISEYQKNQYKAVKINEGDTEIGGLGTKYVVFWDGDVGCYGGNSTIIPNFTVVEHRGFSSIDPIVITDYKFPDLDLVNVTSFSSENGLLLISGVTYGKNDVQHSPTKPVSYTLKLKDNEFTIQ